MFNLLEDFFLHLGWVEKQKAPACVFMSKNDAEHKTQCSRTFEQGFV